MADGHPTRPGEPDAAEAGTVVWLPEHGLVKVFLLRPAAPAGGAGYQVTNDPGQDAAGRGNCPSERRQWGRTTAG